MERFREKFKVNRNVTNEELKKAGFINGIYKSRLYKDLIFLKITIEDNREWWTYQVLNNNKYNTLYVPYYNRILGKNELVEKFDKTIAEIFNYLNQQGIFEKVI